MPLTNASKLSLSRVSQTRFSFSKLSVFLSGLCIIHCLLTPFVLLLIPAFSTFFNRTVESLIVLTLIPLSALGFFPTWLKHKNGRLLSFYLIGLLTVIFTHLGFHYTDINHLFSHTHGHKAPVTVHSHSVFSFEVVLMVVGSLFMAWATWKNNRHTHTCKNPNHMH